MELKLNIDPESIKKLAKAILNAPLDELTNRSSDENSSENKKHILGTISEAHNKHFKVLQLSIDDLKTIIRDYVIENYGDRYQVEDISTVGSNAEYDNLHSFHVDLVDIDKP